MSTLVIGLSISSLLFLVAAGLTLIFGMLGIVNFAHGSLYMLGAYVCFQVGHLTGSFWLALIAAAVAAGVVGLSMERFALRAVAQRDHIYQVLLTFGFILVIEAAAKAVWGADYKQVAPPPALAEPVSLFGVQVPSYRLFVIGAGVAVSAGLFALIDRSRIGIVLRAASSDPETASTLGVDIAWARAVTFAAGAALAGVGGAISAPLVPVELGMGFTVIIDSFIVVIIGGLGNIRGAVMAALLLGLTRAVGYQFAPEWVDIATFVLLIVALSLRPQGLFATKARLA